jgi:hypothetical protein
VSRKMPAQSLASPDLFPAEFPLENRDWLECRQRPVPKGSFDIVREDDRDALLGFAYPCGDGFSVYTPRGACMMKDRQVAVVASPSDALPSLTGYLGQHPENWEDRGYNEHTKFTPYGTLFVGKDCHGKWWAYRGGCALCPG